MLKFASAIATALITVSCATQPKPAIPRPVIKTIAIIPATDPVLYTVENVSALPLLIPLAATANYVDSKKKAWTFNERMALKPLSLGASFTAMIAERLKADGFQVEVLDRVSRPRDDPDDVDPRKIVSTADAVLHLRLTEVGLFSPRSSTDYLPRVNARGTLFVKGLEDDLYDEEIDYGVDAKKATASTIPADGKFAYPSFEAVLANLDEIRNVFETGTREVGARMSDQIRDSAK